MADELEIHLTLRDLKSRRDFNVLLSSDPDAPLDRALDCLRQAHPGPFYLDGNELTGEGRLADAGLRSGAIVYVGTPAKEKTLPSLELVAVGGRNAGFRAAIRPDGFSVGSSSEANVCIDDDRMAPVHFWISLEGKRIFIRNLRDPKALLVENQPIEDDFELVLNEMFRAGDTLFEVRRFVGRADADVAPDDEAHLVFNRPGRIQPKRVRSSFDLPRAPITPSKAGFPWVQTVVPLVFGVGMAFLFHSLFFLAFCIMSPILAGATGFSTNRKNKKTTAVATEEYEAKMDRVENEIYEAARWQSRTMRERQPDAAMLVDVATLPLRRLWERRMSDGDFLVLRLGSSNARANLQVKTNIGDEDYDTPVIFQAPITVDLKKAGVFGVAGAPEETRGVGRWLVSQIATLHAPRDVRLVLLSQDGTEADWGWMRWLPHVSKDREPGAAYCTVAADRYSRDEQVKELLRLLDVRTQQQAGRDPISGPAVVVVYDGIRALREMAGVARLLREGPSVGIFAIGLDSASSRLAQETNAELSVGESSIAMASFRMTGRSAIDRLIADQLSSSLADSLARGLSPLTEAGNEVDGQTLPTAVRFVDMAGIDLDNPENVLSRWAENGRTTSFLIGQSLDGPFSLDLKHDGPHGLVAGTTGAGKSEFLQTLVVSLAYVNRPDALNFLLIDYKGASAFSSCEDLPHTVGLVTNLDGHLTERALVALEAELHRRETVLKDMHASDIDIAWQANPEAAAERGLARLVIVIDEFAELHQELPDFIQGLIRVARVGRSLGVHLILGTQRPSGVVSPEMRANTGLRIALRMEDRADSTEVLEAPDAASISRRTPGRAYARLGGAASIFPFQTARIAGRRRGVEHVISAPHLIPLTWKQLGRPMPIAYAGPTVESETTDLHSLVALINKAAQLSDAARARTPWLPALPHKLILAEPVEEHPTEVVYGLEDRPKDQAQPDAIYDLVHAGHMTIAGSARSGRTTSLRTIAGAIARVWSPSDCHMVGLDFGNGALQALTNLPHCGVVTSRNEGERLGRVIGRLRSEVTNRQAVLARLGVGDINEQRAAVAVDERMPYIVVFLDRWEGFLSEFGIESQSDLQDEVMKLLREGPGVGMRFIITGDQGILNDRMSAQVENKLLLRLNSKDNYQLAGLSSSAIPDDMPDGRAIRLDSHIDVQIGLLSDDASSASQNAALTRIGQRAREVWATPTGALLPLRVDALPEVLPVERLEGMIGMDFAPSVLTPVVAVGGDTLKVFRVDLLADGPYFLIAGQPRTGRSTAALVMAQSILDGGGAVVAVCPRRSPLETIRVRENAFVFKGDESELEAFVDALNSVDQAVAIIVDDCEAIAGNTFDTAMREVVKGHSDEVSAVIVGTIDDMRSSLRGIAADARKSKVGLLFSPELSIDGDLVGLRLPRSKVGRMAPGRAIFGMHGDATVVQVPMP